MIEIIGTTLNQWDTGRSVQVTEIEADHVHFANKGDSKAVIMEIANSQAKIPDYLLQTGKQVCVYAVKNGVTVDSKILYVKTRERPENYVYEDDRRNYIYELITNAETAVLNANRAVVDANLAANDANTAKASATKAAEKATESANSASLAAKNANEAADKANHTAKSLMVVGSAAGDSIHLDDAIDQFLVGLRVFGKTTQSGKPTPEAPVDLVSVENPTVTVNNQTLRIPYTLHGVPVTTGGNYTDKNWQQWICDEIDFDRGVYIQRVVPVNLSNLLDWNTWGVNSYADGQTGFYHYLSYELATAKVLCSILPYAEFAWGGMQIGVSAAPSSGSSPMYITVSVKNNILADVSTNAAACESFKTALSEIGAYMLIAISPIETPLSEEMLAAYATLSTNRGSTTVSNDASAHMAIEYVMDAKKYIDSMLASAARLTSVSLPASKWTGSGHLYSQVVAIDGITENSQVNLTPNVEQLAIFYDKDLTFITENDGGVVTVYVIGQKPASDYIIPANIVEVIT